MSLANGFNRVDGETVSLRRCAANVMTALNVLARPRRVRLPRSDAYSLPMLAIAAGIAIAVFLFLALDDSMLRPAAAPATCRVGSSHLFDDITDFGKSGWFLWPLGLLFLALAALPPALTPFSQRVLAAVMVRVGFLFTAIAVPSLFVTIVKRMIGRARPNVGGSLDPFLFSPFRWEAAYAGLPSGHATTAFAVLVAFGTLWPRARTALLIYAC